MNPFRSPQFENSSKLLSKLETYHLHQTQLSNKPSSHKTIRSPKNQRINNIKRIEIISGTGDRRQKLYRKKGRRKLVLSEKAEKMRKPKSGKIHRKHSDNWNKKIGGRDLLFRQKENNYRIFKKGGSGSPNLQKDISQRTNYSIGNQRFMLNRPFSKNKWTREDTVQSQYDISSEFIHSKENYNMYMNIKRNKAPVMSKMKKIVGLQNSERSLLESMRMSKKGKKDENGKFVTHPMVFIKRKTKKKGKVSTLQKKVISNSRNNSKLQKRPKNNKQKKQDSRSRKSSGIGLTKVRLKTKSPKTVSKKKIGLKSKKTLNIIGNPISNKSSSRNSKKEYMMDVFVSLTHKKGNQNQNEKKTPNKYHFETISKEEQMRKWSQRDEKRENSKRELNSKQTILQNFLKKTDQVEKFIKQLDQSKKMEKQDLRGLITESSKETSQNISSKKESSMEKMTFESLVEKTNETRKLMEIFREQKSSIFENKRQTEDQINSVFLKLLNLMEQERVRALKVVEDQFHAQKQNIFEIEKQLVLKEQNMQNMIR